MKIRKDHVDYVYIGLFILFMAMFLTGQFTKFTGTSLVVIDNADPNSMFPTYFQGDLFVIQRHSPTDIAIGDVIVYSSTGGARIIHRVVDIVTDGGNYFFRVKGDDPVTNYIPDPYGGGSLIPFSAVLGKIVARVPYVGHISLAMQQNIAIQMLIYVLALGIVLAIVFWETDEEEESEKFYEITRQIAEEKVLEIKQALRKFGGIFTSSRYKVLAWTLLIMLILTGFMPYLLPGMIPRPDVGDRGVIQVTFDAPHELKESNSANNVLFSNVYITMYDNGNLLNYIDSYIMQVHAANGTVIDYTVWKSLRPIIGEFTVGGTITISTRIVANLIADGQTDLQVTITPHVNGFGTAYNLDTFTTTFNISS